MLDSPAVTNTRKQAMAEDIRVAAFIPAKPGEEHAVAHALSACVTETRKEPGCHEYILHTDVKDPTIFWMIEHWASQSALDTHMQAAAFQTLVKALDGKLRGAPQINVLKAV